MMLNESDRAEIRLILMTIRDSDLRIIDPGLARMAQRGVDLLKTDEDRARVLVR